MKSKPNIVLIITDQQRLDTIAANGHAHMTTPHLDSLVENGAVFENMYVPSPSCAPSRASLFSGTYPHTNGVMRNDEPWSYCFVEELAKTGYRCVNVGKMHTMPIEGAFGFHERHVTENKDRDFPTLPFYLDNWDKALWARKAIKPSRNKLYSDLPDYSERLGAFVWEQDEDLHVDVFVGQTACWWLERYPGEEPFFLQVGFPGPHPPYDATQRYIDMYIDQDLPQPIRDYDLEAHPTPLRVLRQNHIDSGHDAIIHKKEPTPSQLHRQRAHYYANVTMIDDQVGQIVSALKTRGVLDDTVIIFTTDHGDCLNDHGLSQKWNMFEPTVHVPAIVCWPEKIKGTMRITDIVSLMDFAPTILDIAGADVPEWMEAESLMNLLLGEPGPKRSLVFSEHSNDEILKGTQFMTMVRSESWKLVHFVDSDEGQLFNLDDDPEERNNLWDDGNYKDNRQNLMNELLNWRIQSSLKTQGFVQRSKPSSL